MILPPEVRSITADGVAEARHAGDRPQEIVVSMMPASTLRRTVRMSETSGAGSPVHEDPALDDALQVEVTERAGRDTGERVQMPPRQHLETSAGTG